MKFKQRYLGDAISKAKRSAEEKGETKIDPLYTFRDSTFTVDLENGCVR